jgi:hypothetical protein
VVLPQGECPGGYLNPYASQSTLLSEALMTINTGQSLEHEIEDYLNLELKRGELGIDPKHAQVFRHKGYHSSLRGKPIIVDVSLELYRSGTAEPYFIWIWECKDYAKSVPVDDIEEFHGKLEQLGMHRIKGTIACRNGFQDGAIRVARGWGIGLVRLLPNGSIIRLLGAVRTISIDLALFGLTEPQTQKLESMFYGITSDGNAPLKMADLIRIELRGMEHGEPSDA